MKGTERLERIGGGGVVPSLPTMQPEGKDSMEKPQQFAISQERYQQLLSLLSVEFGNNVKLAMENPSAGLISAFGCTVGFHYDGAVLTASILSKPLLIPASVIQSKISHWVNA